MSTNEQVTEQVVETDERTLLGSMQVNGTRSAQEWELLRLLGAASRGLLVTAFSSSI